MSALSKFSLKNSVVVVILCVLVLGLGFYSTTKIKQQTFPDISFPAVFVQAVYPGGSTEEVETEVTNPVEGSLQSLKGYDSLTSTSSENAASIFLQYPFGTNMDDVTKDVEGALAKLTLPDKAKVSVQRLSAGAQPIYQAAIFSTKDDPAALQKTLQEQVVPKLRKAEGVSSVTLKGTKSEELRIEVDKAKANQYGLSLSAIQSALQSLNYALPLGSVNQNETTIPLSLVGKVNGIQQIKDLELQVGAVQSAQGTPESKGTDLRSVPSQSSSQASGKQAATGTALLGPKKVKLSEIASVTTISTQNEITRFDGKDSYVIEVVKNQDANTADVATEVKGILASFQAKSNLDIHVISDQGAAIEESVSSLIREGLYGALFCVIIIFLFLRNVRATLISILALPISVFATIAIMNQMGYTLNIMTLGGIAVSIGRIVDDSIVVIENIFRWRQEKGSEMKGKELAYHATKEVIGAVGSSTFATIVVFLPLAFVSGIIGEFFRPFAIAVVISILFSLLVAMMLIPVLGARFFNQIKPHKQGGRFIDTYEKLIRGALRRKGWVLGLALIILVGSLGTIPLLGVSFLPASSVPSIQIDMTLPNKSGIEQTSSLSEKVEGYLKDLKGVDNYQVAIGDGGAGNRFMQAGSTANKAVFNVQFKEGTVMDTVIDHTTKDLQTLVDHIAPETSVNVKGGEQQGPPSGNNIDVSLYASDLTALSKASAQVENLLKQNSDLKDITNNLKDVTPKWVLSINKTGRDANVSSYQIMQVVNEQLRPTNVGTYTLDNKSQDITMAYQQQISSKEQLENIDIPTAAGMKKLKDIVDVTQAVAPISVNHEDGKTYAKLSATVKGENTAATTKTVTSDIESLSLPSGVDYKIGGGTEMINSGFSSIGLAMGAAIGLVFLVLSMTFGGLLTPLIILSSLLFVPIGALGGLLVTGQSLSMSAMIGMLMLVGIVVTNAVVLLDRVEKNRKSGIPLTEAIVEASKTRLRPILMTACATILALVPLALSQSTTSLISGGLAITVIGGLTTSTLLTLIVVPVIYQMTGKRRKLEENNF
ncbi:swarming motility protein SwrC [Paenibacillus baekrokdamisoli]|uniref:Swarming motility protein SwrC n=1 Tax=Paenibacillus baekrokdamisoli TaxID=1712516 RepID=A0A3G9JA39_9BACL|nr:efflux RND transporter permease subunit [Paenibacillus baekrokdamisoli]MBB3069890.1 HAE1 family hydrophobic/amphiphilic exporter-1 [Paenibacillus baekrokdamisoli]BBH20758.1 swarming motility protein SwrC [Paenibacillus baekrokdamisoli]